MLQHNLCQIIASTYEDTPHWQIRQPNMTNLTYYVNSYASYKYEKSDTLILIS